MSAYLRVLKRYGVLVEDVDGWVDELTRVPYRKEGETFKQWKIRTFGEDVKDLAVYKPCIPSPNTKMSTLYNNSGLDYLLEVLENYRELGVEELGLVLEDNTTLVNKLQSDLKKNTKKITEKVTKEVTEKLTTIPKDLLQDIIYENETSLEPSALEFLDRYIQSNSNRVDTKEILSDLIVTYSKVVTLYRQMNNK